MFMTPKFARYIVAIERIWSSENGTQQLARTWAYIPTHSFHCDDAPHVHVRVPCLVLSVWGDRLHRVRPCRSAVVVSPVPVRGDIGALWHGLVWVADSRGPPRRWCSYPDPWDRGYWRPEVRRWRPDDWSMRPNDWSMRPDDWSMFTARIRTVDQT